MSSVLIFSSDMKDATDLPKQLNYDIEDLIKHISDNNKKYLLLSLLKINIKLKIPKQNNEYTNYIEYTDLNTDMNFLINYFLRIYDNSINIYPKNLNIIHFIIFNKLNIYNVLLFLIKIYYCDNMRLTNPPYMDIYNNGPGTCYGCSTLILNICNSYDDNNVNMLFNHNYTDLLFNGPGPTISDEISILTDKINNLQIQTDYNYNKINEDIILIKINEVSIIDDINQLNLNYNENNINKTEIMNEISILTDKINNLQIQTDNFYKLNEEYNVNKTKIIDDINQLNLNYNENKTEIMNEIYILTDKMNDTQIQTDYHYNKINEDMILIKNDIINDVKQLINENNINNNKLINEITLLTTKINDSQTQNNYYYNKIKILESKTYILNRILLIIIIIYFLIIFIIGTLFMFLIFNYDNIIDKEVLIYYYKKYIYIDDNPIVKLQLLN